MVISYTELKDISMKNIAELSLGYYMLAQSQKEKSYTTERLMPDSSELHKEGRIRGYNKLSRERTFLYIEPEPEERQVGTAGFDLRVGKLIAETDTIAEKVTKKDLLEIPHKILEPGEEFVFNYDEDGSKIYYVTSFERVSLSSNLEMIVDSKSTTGRVGAMSHGVGMTDEGELITIIQPFAFPLKVKCGKTRLSQVVIRYKETPYMTNNEVLSTNEIKFEGDGVSIKDSLIAKGLLMKFNTALVYRAKKCDKPINMGARGKLEWKNYFEAVEGNSQLTLDKKTLYLLGSLGVIDLGEVCGLLSREQEVITGTGAWGHFAGVFQPFFRGGITFEFYSHSKRKISRGDKAGTVIFDKVEGVVNRPKDYGGAYQNQRPPLLPKMFRV